MAKHRHTAGNNFFEPVKVELEKVILGVSGEKIALYYSILNLYDLFTYFDWSRKFVLKPSSRFLASLDLFSCFFLSPRCFPRRKTQFKLKLKIKCAVGVFFALLNSSKDNVISNTL